MDNKLKRRSKPRLDRRNAIKNIDYEAPSSDLCSSLRTRSLDVSPLGYQTSFRVGGDDGEIDRIVWELGLSGPEDLAISAAAWAARKGRSVSDVLPRSRLHDQFGSNSTQPRATLVVIDAEVGATATNTERVGGGGGIKGVRPPLLSPPPPPSLPLPLPLPLPCECSTAWSFPPPHPPDNDNETSSAEEEEEEDDPNKEELMAQRRRRGGETNLLSESCSSSTFNDDDSSSTTTDPMYIISPDAKCKRNIKSWLKGALLGSGSFGTVYEGFSDDGFFFAVKEVSLLDQGNQAKQSISQLEQEISLLSQFEHENIVQYLGTDKDEEKLYIFLELVTKGSLAQLYQKYPLQDSQVSAYTRQILHGLSYLHERDVVHRDIKCANILVDANGSVKLADFGLAKATKFNDVKSCKGTAFWMAPEVVNRKSHGYGLAADIWSLGCTVLEMLTRQLPYSHLECPMQALFRIGKGEPPPVPNSLSKAARDFIHQCLQVKADDRPTAAQLLEHSFVKRPLSASTGPGSPLHHNWRRP